MKPVRTPDCDVTLTLPGGTQENDLPAQRIMVYNGDAGETEADARLAFESTWMPDDAEARRLEAGAPVVLRITGKGHPPVSLTVGHAVVPERELVARSTIDTAIGKLFADLKERIAVALLQAQKEGATAEDMVDTGGEVNPEAVGFPSAPVFSDLWIAALQAAQGVTTAGENEGLIANGGADVTTSQKLDAETMNTALEAIGSGVRVKEGDAATAIAECATCGMPVRVVFDAAGEVERVLAPCGHPQKDDSDA